MALPKSFSPSEHPLFLMDGSAYMYRGFYANSNLQRSDGFPTGALTVVTRILLRVLRRERPTHFAFVKDGHGPNFRHEIFPAYKANRMSMPEDLAKQIGPIEAMVRALGLHYEESKGCEADDCIASLAHRFGKDFPVVIVSADKDLKQCLTDRVLMWDPAGKDEKIFTKEGVEEENGIPIALWPDLQALTGDSVDNIPGVPGIGPKTAIALLRDFPGLENLRDRFSLVSPKYRKKLEGHLEDMFLYRRLTTLSTKECADLSLDDLAVRPPDVNEALRLAKEFEMRALMREIMDLARESAMGVSRDAGSPARGENADRTAKPHADKGAPSLVAACLDGDEGDLLKATMPLSLLDLAAGAGSKNLDHLSDASALPDCARARVAVVRPEATDREPLKGPLVVGVRKGDAEEAPAKETEDGQDRTADVREFVWEGDEAALARWTEQAERLVVVSVKELLAQSSPWRETLLARLEGKAVHDLSLAAYLFSPEESGYSWARIAGQASLPDEVIGRGAGAVALALESWGRARMAREGLEPLYRDLELPLTAVLADMEATGIGIDMPAFEHFLGEVRQELALLTQQIYEAAGEEFNLRSSKQLGDLLYGRLGLKSSRKTRQGQASTSQETLESLAGHPVVDGILRFRKLEKMRSTYLEPLPRLTDRQGRLHTTFNQEATATGRLSSSNPNLQNIPVRGALGKRMRSCFVAREGCVLVSCDYSQIELRVLAGLSRDRELVQAFARGEDIHARTAALIYETEPELITPDQRRNAKTINFGLVYGMGAQKLAREIGSTTNEAKAFIQRYFAKLTGLKAFYEKVEEDAALHGYVSTLGGRRRPLPNINSNNAQEKALARRQAVNTVIQGSAADIIKMAMLDVWRDPELRSMDARMVLQVHDELVLEVPEAWGEACGRRVVALMEGVKPGGRTMEPGLKVDWGLGRDWGAAH